MAHNPVGWFEIYVDDLPRARKFYETVLGVELESLDVPDETPLQMLAFPSYMEKHGTAGALVNVPGMPAGGNSTIVYFSCEDCAVEESRVAEAGGTVKTSKMSIGQYGFVAHAIDTEGNMIGLHSRK